MARSNLPTRRSSDTELVRAGQTPEDLAREFEPSAQGDLQLGRAGRP